LLSPDPSVSSSNVLRIIPFWCPVFFSMAHVHHAYERWREGLPLTTILIQVTIQASYTYIFGVISVILLVRAGHIGSCLISHVICNFMGLPNIEFMVEGSPASSGYRSLYRYRYPLLCLHGLGLILFAWALYPVTESLSKHSIYYRLWDTRAS
jgi:prenyl protein peptidase